MALVSNDAKNVGIFIKIRFFFICFPGTVIFLTFKKPAFHHLATSITDGLADLQTITDPVSSLMAASLDIVGMCSDHIQYSVHVYNRKPISVKEKFIFYSAKLYR
jgi:hypothetical protein